MATTVEVPDGVGASALLAIPHVRSVHKDRLYEPRLFASRDVLNATGAYARLGAAQLTDAGKGVRVALLDAGVYIKHAMFNDTNMSWPDDVPAPGRGDTTNTNAKVPVSRLYEDPEMPPYSGDSKSYPAWYASMHGIQFAASPSHLPGRRGFHIAHRK